MMSNYEIITWSRFVVVVIVVVNVVEVVRWCWI